MFLVLACDVILDADEPRYKKGFCLVNPGWSLCEAEDPFRDWWVEAWCRPARDECDHREAGLVNYIRPEWPT